MYIFEVVFINLSVAMISKAQNIYMDKGVTEPLPEVSGGLEKKTGYTYRKILTYSPSTNFVYAGQKWRVCKKVFKSPSCLHF